jgi:RNA polymerase sigma-70 factor (ECF subfamily)
MADEESFAGLIERLRAGDDQAAAELVRRYEPAIRLEVRRRLRDVRLHRLFDASDICQSVLASFFVRAAAGQYELRTPDELQHLLVTIARRKVAYAVRQARAQRRDYRRATSLEGAEHARGGDPSPSQLVAGRDLLQQFRSRLTPEECRLVDLRGQGLNWAEIAAQIGGTRQGRRMQLCRAVERVSAELGLGGEEP